jgi:LPXTG-motif cell wall-anchored protein
VSVSNVGSIAFDLPQFGTFSVKDTTVGAPEIDPASTAAGLTLLIGGLMVLRGRKRQYRSA